MPQLTGTLLPEGAIIDALIGVNRTEVMRLRRALKPIPPPKQIRALVDSGAEVTCLDPDIINDLALPWFGPIPANISTLTGWTLTSLYRADLTILHPSGQPSENFVVSDLAICEVALSPLNYHALIGRDILDQVRFTYDGPARGFTLDWR
jgi:hypothetical protein